MAKSNTVYSKGQSVSTQVSPGLVCDVTLDKAIIILSLTSLIRTMEMRTALYPGGLRGIHMETGHMERG